MRALPPCNVGQAIATNQRMRVSVVLEKLSGPMLRMPWSDKLDEHPYGRRDQSAVGPHHLRTVAGRTVPLRFLREKLVVQEAQTAKAWLPRTRKDDLTRYYECSSHGRDVHAHVDVRDEKAAGESFDFLPGRLAVDASEHDVTVTKRQRIFLPCLRYGGHLSH